MKWWYVVVLLVGVGIGWWVLRDKKVGQNLPLVSSEKSTDQMTVDFQGKDVPTIELSGVVKSWDPKKGIIEFEVNGQIRQLVIDPSETVIFVPSLTDKNREIKISDKNNVHWNSAFCQGDMVVFRLAGEKVVLVSNGGYRTCGFKGD